MPELEDQPAMPNEFDVKIFGTTDGTIHIEFSKPISTLSLTLAGAAGMSGNLSMILSKMLTPEKQIIQAPNGVVTPKG